MFRYIVFVLFLSLTVQLALAQDHQFQDVKDLSTEWYFKTNKGFLPYIVGNATKTDAIIFKINPARYSGDYLKVKSLGPGALFVNGEIVINENISLLDELLSLDSLGSVYKNKPIHISIFLKKGINEYLSTVVVKPIVTFNSRGFDYSIHSKYQDDNSYFFVIIILLAIYFTILFITDYRNLFAFYALDQILLGRVRDESIYRLRLFNWPNVQIYIYHSALLAFLLVVFEKYNDFSQMIFFNVEGILLKWILIALVIFILLILKYMIIRYIGLLFDLKASANYYYFEYMRMSIVFFGILFLVSIIFMIKWPLLLEGYSLIAFECFMFFLLIRFIVIFIRIGRKTSFKNLHLFSYLCATEILPVVVGLRYFLSF